MPRRPSFLIGASMAVSVPPSKVRRGQHEQADLGHTVTVGSQLSVGRCGTPLHARTSDERHCHGSAVRTASPPTAMLVHHKWWRPLKCSHCICMAGLGLTDGGPRNRTSVEDYRHGSQRGNASCTHQRHQQLLYTGCAAAGVRTAALASRAAGPIVHWRSGCRARRWPRSSRPARWRPSRPSSGRRWRWASSAGGGCCSSRRSDRCAGGLGFRASGGLGSGFKRMRAICGMATPPQSV